jgi:peptidyl-prolyl cis-trans isomerase SurA
MIDWTRPMRLLASVFVLAFGLGLAIAGAAATAQVGGGARSGDWIVAVVNQELVTAGEVERRLEQVRDAAQRSGRSLPPEAELRRQVVDALIDERVIVTYARDAGLRVDDAELDRAVQNVAAQNQITPAQLRERLRAEGLDYARFRANLRDQLLIERVREREVFARIRINEDEVDAAIARQRSAAAADVELDIAQILVTVPEGADAATVAARRQRALQALARVRGGESFAAVARDVSEDSNRERGGEIGLRPASRLPDLFVAAVRSLAPGQVTPELLRSGAGFHVLKLLDRRQTDAIRVTETRVRHILLRTSPQLTPEVAIRRLAEYRRQIESGARRFEDLAREYSEDASAAAGGDLGWTAPGAMVPEFEAAMDRLPPGGISQPVPTRFGVHLIQVLDRRQAALDPKRLREQVRNQLREQKFEAAYLEWAADLRARAYIEMREPPTS